jgi:hypothetical protein
MVEPRSDSNGYGRGECPLRLAVAAAPVAAGSAERIGWLEDPGRE